MVTAVRAIDRRIACDRMSTHSFGGIAFVVASAALIVAAAFPLPTAEGAPPPPPPKHRDVVINTWPFTAATDAAWSALQSGGDALDAVVAGVSTCERDQCDGTVGFGGSPDEKGGVSLDAMIMDGTLVEAGGVVNLRHTRDAIATARLVMDLTVHTLLAGEQADQFASEMGMPQSSLVTNHSTALWEAWRKNDCQPNFRRQNRGPNEGLTPDPSTSCGPYHRTSASPRSASHPPPPSLTHSVSRMTTHDTIAMLVLHRGRQLASGTSTNGATHKVPGRIADSAIPGAGSYAIDGIGAW